MEQTILDKIHNTVDGYEVKELRYIKADNIVVGFVKCPIWGEKRLNGFVTCKWRTNGSCIKDNRRKDLYLDMTDVEK